MISRAVLKPAAPMLPFAGMCLGLAFAASWTQRVRAEETEPLAAYYDNTYLWKDLDTQAVGRLWLNRDGHYAVFYNLGPQARMPDSHGPWQVQGREGSYTLRTRGTPWQLCLWPAAPRSAIGAAQQHELYAEGGCYEFTAHAVGDVWKGTDDSLHRPYKFWLVAGR